MKEVDDKMAWLSAQLDAAIKAHPTLFAMSEAGYIENYQFLCKSIAAIKVPIGYLVVVKPLTRTDIDCRLPFTVEIQKT